MQSRLRHLIFLNQDLKRRYIIFQRLFNITFCCPKYQPFIELPQCSGFKSYSIQCYRNLLIKLSRISEKTPKLTYFISILICLKWLDSPANNLSQTKLNHSKIFWVWRIGLWGNFRSIFYFCFKLNGSTVKYTTRGLQGTNGPWIWALLNYW